MSFEVTVVQSLGRHTSREVVVTVENALSRGEAYRRIASHLTRECEVKSVREAN